MTTDLATTTTKKMFAQVNVKKRFEDLLGEKAQGFISSVLQTVQNNKLLAKAKPETILNAAASAAVLDLPINQNLGFAWIVPYGNEAQFQIGWKGFVQLGLRTGQYNRLNVVEIYKNQFKSYNALTEELDAEMTKDGVGEVVGYVAYLRLCNGFEKTVYWSKKKVIEHAKKYSKTYGKKNQSGKLIHSPWNDSHQFDSMAKKTVLKNTISKWGIMSIEMQKAQVWDQAVIKDEPEYVDNVITGEDKKEELAEKGTQTHEMP